MKKHKIDAFTKGWFIGDFKPTLLATKDFETAVKFYKRGDREGRHVHKIAVEFTIIGAGKFRINDMILEAGDIIEIRPGEPGDFECLESGVMFVVKSPSAPHDKEMV
jgi:hypothetical protein